MDPRTPPPAPPPAPAPPRRAWLRRTLIGFLIVANIAIFGGLAALLFAANEVASSIDTIASDDLPLVDPPSRAGQPRTFLLVGSDSREGVPEEEINLYGRFGGERADVIMLLQVLPDDGRLQLLSIPRDTKVTLDGRTMKINAAFSEGPAAIANAVVELTGVPINHYMQVDFAGFAGIVDAVGGIEMTFPNPVRDVKSHLYLDAGTYVLDGTRAIAVARSRFYEEQVDGRWVYVDASDIGRTGRQRDLLLAMLTQVDRPSSVGGFRDLVNALGAFVLTDDRFDAQAIIDLAWEMRSVGVADVDSMVLPVRGLDEGGVAYVVPIAAEAETILQAFRASTPIAAATADPIVVVQNGNGRPGSAGAVAEALSVAGFEVADATNATRDDHGTTLVVARPTALTSAERIREALGYGSVMTGSVPSGIDVVVIVGLDAPAP